jgi:glutamate-1-semialdehyde 2,1-aminomutase
MKFTKSLELYSKAKNLTPLAAQTYSKSYRYHAFGSAPIFLSHGKGSKVWDIDGNRFIDFVCALGPVTVGYNNKNINNAIKSQLKKGITFSLPHPIGIILAEKLTRIIPGVEMVRFLKNGADATFAAIKLARAFTGKDIVLMSGYHGMHDWSIVTTNNNLGVPKALIGTSIGFEYNNIEQLLSIIEDYKDQVAAIILEPIQGDGPKKDYLQRLREVATQNGIILIFDEVVSGFRYSLGGASELYNVTPDLIAFGKGMANGMPLSVVGGKSEILSLIETKKVFISTTFGGETLSISSALSTIIELEKPGTYEKLWRYGESIKNGLEKLIIKFDLSNYVRVIGLAPHCGPVFNSFNDIDMYDLMSIYSREMLSNGILTVGIINLSKSHDYRDIDKYLIASEITFKKIKDYIIGDYNIDFEGRVNPVFKR